MKLKEASVVILTNRIPLYRISTYSQFSDYCGSLLVIHHGDRRGSVKFAEETYRKRDILRGIVLSRFSKSADKADLVIVMFDLHYVSYLKFIAQRKVSEKPLLLWGHGFGKSEMGNQIRKLILRASSGLILYNEQAKQKLEDAGVDPNKLFVAHNSMEVVEPMRATGRRDSFVFIGRIQDRKRVDLLIEAFAEIVVSSIVRKDLKLVILGDGDGKPALIAQCAKLSISDRVTFMNGTFRADLLKQVYDRAIAYVSPGHVGLGIIQSFGHGVPVVTFDVQGHAPEAADIINEHNGLFVAAKSKTLYDNLYKLATDDAFVAFLGENALSTYNRYDLSQMVESLAYASTKALDSYV